MSLRATNRSHVSSLRAAVGSNTPPRPRKGRITDAFEIRYEDQVDPDAVRWELCSRVLARRDIVEKLSNPW